MSISLRRVLNKNNRRFRSSFSFVTLYVIINYLLTYYFDFRKTKFLKMKSTVYRRGKILYAREFYFKRKKRPIFLILMIPLYSSSKNSSVCSRYSHGSTVTSAMNNIYYIHNKIVLSLLMPLSHFCHGTHVQFNYNNVVSLIIFFFISFV